MDERTLIPDETLSIDEGAVAPWNSLMWSLMTDVCRAMGVRTDVPFCELSDEEKEIVYNGPMVKKHIFYKAKNTESVSAGEMDFTYYSATATVLNALNKVKDEKGMKRVEKFLHEDVCPDCGGTRLNERARSLRVQGNSLDEVCTYPLSELIRWVNAVPGSLPEPMRPMAKNICEAFRDTAKRLVDLGLSYLSLDRASATLSTGERQRVQLARSVRNRTTGVLYVLDEPSIGLHPSNLEGLTGVMDDLIADGNSVILVDHDTQVLAHADYLIELGPEAGAKGGQILAEGTVRQLIGNPLSRIGKFLEKKQSRPSENAAAAHLFDIGEIRMTTAQLHTVKPLDVRFPKGRLTVVTGVSGSGKTTMVLESLIPALQAHTAGKTLPDHVLSVAAEGVRQIKLIDATPIGINIRSTVATYANVHDELRKIYARTPDAKRLGRKAGDLIAAVHGDVGVEVARADGCGLVREADDAAGQPAGVPEEHGHQHHGGHHARHAAVQHVFTRAGVVGDGDVVDAVGKAHGIELPVHLVAPGEDQVLPRGLPHRDVQAAPHGPGLAEHLDRFQPCGQAELLRRVHRDGHIGLLQQEALHGFGVVAGHVPGGHKAVQVGVDGGLPLGHGARAHIVAVHRGVRGPVHREERRQRAQQAQQRREEELCAQAAGKRKAPLSQPGIPCPRPCG